MNIYDFIKNQENDSCVYELGKYLAELYNIDANLRYGLEEHHWPESHLNHYSISISNYEISIYSDNEIYILEKIITIGKKVMPTESDIENFFKYYKRKKILDGLL